MPQTPTVVVPIAVLKQETIPETLAEFLSPAPILLLGVVDIPDQTSGDQAREQFETGAKQVLQTVSEQFAAHGADVDTRLSFTHNVSSTVEQVATDIDRVAILVPAPMTEVGRVLVAVRGGVNVPTITATVAALVADRETTVTVYHAAKPDADASDAERVLEGTARALVDAGVDRSRVTTTVERSSTPIESLLQAANDHDLLVVGEDKPTLRDQIFGDTSARIAERATVPVLVVRRPPVEE